MLKNCHHRAINIECKNVVISYQNKSTLNSENEVSWRLNLRQRLGNIAMTIERQFNDKGVKLPSSFISIFVQGTRSVLAMLNFQCTPQNEIAIFSFFLFCQCKKGRRLTSWFRGNSVQLTTKFSCWEDHSKQCIPYLWLNKGMYNLSYRELWFRVLRRAYFRNCSCPKFYSITTSS